MRLVDNLHIYFNITISSIYHHFDQFTLFQQYLTSKLVLLHLETLVPTNMAEDRFLIQCGARAALSNLYKAKQHQPHSASRSGRSVADSQMQRLSPAYSRDDSQQTASQPYSAFMLLHVCSWLQEPR